MTRCIDKVLVMGIGKVGTLVATMLHDNGFAVTGLDNRKQTDHRFPVQTGDVTDVEALKDMLGKYDAVVSCLPFDLNIDVARAAHAQGIHYFDLTEDVPTTTVIRELSETAKGAMAPQCGLAPGLIGIIGASLTRDFEELRSIELRVGALPENPRGLLGYAFIWSPEGVVNEYLNDCQVIESGKVKWVLPMEQLETIVIGGVRLEAFTTSGGLGTMCETYEGKVTDLNYKTMRYPGHCELMNFFFHELRMTQDRKLAGEILVNAKPPVNDDVVYVYAAVEGYRKGRLFREEFVRDYYPRRLHGAMWRAISWTTAASACAVVELVASGVLPNQGFIKQEEVPFDRFLETKTGSLYTTSK